MTALQTQVRIRDVHRSFHDFVASRPDEEKWELIAGRSIMQAQPNFDHQIIASNLERLLNDGLERLGVAHIAMQNPAIDLRPTIEGHTYVPDVAILDLADIEQGRNVTRTCYLVAEIISPSDRRRPSGMRRQKIGIKIDGYEAIPMCAAILVIEEASFDVTVALRRGDVWTQERHTTLDARIALPTAGVQCRLLDIYARTALMRTHLAR